MVDIGKVAVIGAGTMGNGIAHVCSANGFHVSLFDVSEGAATRGLAAIRSNMERQVRKGTLTSAGMDEALARIVLQTDLTRAVVSADLVIEAATERKDTKLEIFRNADAAAPSHALLASNTSSISITEIAAATRRPDRVIGMHFMNPVPVMRLVEVIRGHMTSDATTGAILDVCKKLEKVPVEVNDSPGFVANRILMPMLNEAMYCVMEGVATPEAIDTVMKLGMAHPMGPLALADFIGLDVCLAILNVLHEGIGDPKYRPCPLLKKMVAAGQLGKKSGKGFFSYESN